MSGLLKMFAALQLCVIYKFRERGRSGYLSWSLYMQTTWQSSVFAHLQFFVDCLFKQFEKGRFLHPVQKNNHHWDPKCTHFFFSLSSISLTNPTCRPKKPKIACDKKCWVSIMLYELEWCIFSLVCPLQHRSRHEPTGYLYTDYETKTMFQT